MLFETIQKSVMSIKTKRPLIINISNDVTMDFIANGLLSMGASPIMTQSAREIDDLLAMAQGVVINIGTLNDAFITLCEYVLMAANRLGIPVILDPVGAGASHYRTQTCLAFLERFHISMIRGNAGEIMALAGFSHMTRGVDTGVSLAAQAMDSAQSLAARFDDMVIAVSGKTDLVIDANHIQQFEHGSPLMPMVTGSGCLLTAVIAAFAAVEPVRFDAVSAALVFYGVCGEIAAGRAAGPGSFRMHFLDVLSYLPESHYYE